MRCFNDLQQSNNIYEDHGAQDSSYAFEAPFASAEVPGALNPNLASPS